MSPRPTGNMGRPGMGVTSGGTIDTLPRPTTGGSTGIVAPHHWVLGARIYLKSGTQYLSDDYVRTDAALYEGRVLDFGFIERSMDAPASPPRIGDCQLRIVDTDRRLRTLLATQTGMRRLVELVRITDQAILGGFEITKLSFGDGWVEVRGRDILSKVLDKYIPSIGTRANYPYMIQGRDEFFGNIVCGNQWSTVENPQGRVPCDHIGQTTLLFGGTAVDRYCVSRYDLFIFSGRPPVVYRKLRGDAVFSVVPAAEYVFTKNEHLVTSTEDYLPTYLDFLAVQDEDAEIRIDTYGYNSVSDLGTLSVRSWDGASVELRNPIDHLYKLTFETMASMGGDSRFERYNFDSYTEVRAQCDALEYVMDRCISQPMTFGNFIAQWTASAEILFYINRHYQYEVRMVLAEDTGRVVVSDDTGLLTSEPQTAMDPFNRFKYRHGLNVCSEEWSGAGTYDNTDDQAELGNVDYQENDDQIEALDVDLPFCDDAAMALGVITRRADLQALGSHRIQFDVPTPEYFELLELGKSVGVTDPLGLANGGWTNAEFIPLSIRHDLGQLRTTVGAILRTPVEYGVTGNAPVAGLVFLWN